MSNVHTRSIKLDNGINAKQDFKLITMKVIRQANLDIDEREIPSSINTAKQDESTLKVKINTRRNANIYNVISDLTIRSL